MDIKLIPLNTALLIDANIFLYHLSDASNECSDFLDKVTDVKDLLQLPIQVIEVTLADIAVSHQLRQTHGLFVNDSINLACAQRFGITDIVSRDTDFSAVSVLSVWQPTDI